MINKALVLSSAQLEGGVWVTGSVASKGIVGLLCFILLFVLAMGSAALLCLSLSYNLT